MNSKLQNVIIEFLDRNSFRGIAHTHTVYVCSSALTASSARSAFAGPRDRLGHPDTAYHKSTSHSLKHGLADALKYILEWEASVCTAIPHLSVQFVQSLADAIKHLFYRHDLSYHDLLLTACTLFWF